MIPFCKLTLQPDPREYPAMINTSSQVSDWFFNIIGEEYCIVMVDQVSPFKETTGGIGKQWMYDILVSVLYVSK